LRLQASEDLSVRSGAYRKFNGIAVSSQTSIYGRNIGKVLVWAVIVILVLLPIVGWASDQQSIVRGRELYLHYCAACHGKDADGRGPVAEDLKASPPDLRYLGERYGMPLPIGTIARFIDGRQDIAAHGPRTMPVWGKRFYDIWTTHQAGGEDFQSQIREIVSYLNAVQQVPRPSASPHSPITSR
jgi:mono/diheme cytochrome c family protein